MNRCLSVVALLVATSCAVVAQSPNRWSWQESHAKVLPTGGLEWAPGPFSYTPGGDTRYIDFDNGDDARDGLTRETAWKHHPWDVSATGMAGSCGGVHTYVFKQGVAYRGTLEADESGRAGAPIVLTRDPTWGEGPAVICGSEVARGWKRGADEARIPDAEKVWFVDLDWAPRCVWMVDDAGAVSRIPLARTPNWTITDPDDIQSQWWTWKNPQKPFDNVVTINGGKRHLAFDSVGINASQPQDYYEGALVWTTKGWVMGSPFQARVLAADREAGSLAFAGQWGGEPSYKIIRGCRYYLEDKPHYLDSPGEFWFRKQGEGGRLYLRLPGDQDPSRVRVEVARRVRLIESRRMSHVQIRGLTFRFSNVYWNLTAAPYWVSQESIDVEPACVRLLGSGTDIVVSHCSFEHVHRGVRVKAEGPNDVIDQVVVDDNRFSDCDAGGVELADGTEYASIEPPMGRLRDVRVRRNSFEQIGFRPDLFGQGGALVVSFAETVELAGNIFHRVAAQGIDVRGAKQSRAATDRPFTRIMIHHNEAVDTLLNVDDFGGIETWQGGPAYVYNNISGNPGGYRNWDHVLSPDTEDRFGHAYYLDGAFKNYYFNNIAWGKSKGPSGPLANTAAFQQIISYENAFFNNTIYNFVRGSRRQAPQAGRVKFLGNIWQSMGERVFRDADPAQTAAAGNEADAGPRRTEFALETNAYARNVFFDTGPTFAVYEPSGRWLDTLDAFQGSLEGDQPLAASVGMMARTPPLRDAAAHDFRPSDDPATRGLGAKVFVPWSLYETVGEWNFCPLPGDPTMILDEHWCMAPYHTSRDDYYKFPTYPLRGVNIKLENFESGPLENWTTGALRLNGRDQYAVLANGAIEQSVESSVAQASPHWVKATVPAAMRPGQGYSVELMLAGVEDGMRLHADLHWSKASGEFGGNNTWGGPPQVVKGPGPYTFRFQPQDKPELGHFVLTVFLSPTGTWADRTLLTTATIPVGDDGGKRETLTMGGEPLEGEHTVSGPNLKNPQIHTSSFLIEAYFKTVPSARAAVLLQKRDQTVGFELRLNEAGGVTLNAQASGGNASLDSQGVVNDGKWHHVVAESDRPAGIFRLYIDGALDSEGAGLSEQASLANGGDLCVGGGPAGACLEGVVEFVRLARGTLADSRTTIEELYAWEFDGPFLRDFTGRERPADGGSAGAIDGGPTP